MCSAILHSRWENVNSILSRHIFFFDQLYVRSCDTRRIFIFVSWNGRKSMYVEMHVKRKTKIYQFVI